MNRDYAKPKTATKKATTKDGRKIYKARGPPRSDVHSTRVASPKKMDMPPPPAGHHPQPTREKSKRWQKMTSMTSPPPKDFDSPADDDDDDNDGPLLTRTGSSKHNAQWNNMKSGRDNRLMSPHPKDFNSLANLSSDDDDDSDGPHLSRAGSSNARWNNMKSARANRLMEESPGLFSKLRKQDDSISLFYRDEVIVGRTLGSGTYGDVFEIDSFQCRPESVWSAQQTFSRQFYADTAKNKKGEDRYVMKHLKSSRLEDPKRCKIAMADFAREAQFLTLFEHPYILSICGGSAESSGGFKDGTYDGKFLILHRLNGTLIDKIKDWKREERLRARGVVARNHHSSRKGGPLAERLQAAFQIASALAYVHERGVIYRDLKPANVGVDVDDNIKLFDFGFAREVPSSSKTGNGATGEEGMMDDVYKMSGKVGTRRYMAPEVMLKKKYNLKADVYSWACTAYFLLSLQRPFEGYSGNEELHVEHVCRQGRRPHFPDTWPHSLKKLLDQSWAQEISARPTMQQVADCCKHILAELGSKADVGLSMNQRWLSSFRVTEFEC